MFGLLPQATLRGAQAPVPAGATTGELLPDGIASRVRMRERDEFPGGASPVSAVSAYLREAGRWCGVATKDRVAVAAAEACLRSGTAVIARIELARVTVVAHLQPAYERTGTGWTGRLDGGESAWTDLSDLVPLDGEAVVQPRGAPRPGC